MAGGVKEHCVRKENADLYALLLYAHGPVFLLMERTTDVIRLAVTAVVYLVTGLVMTMVCAVRKMFARGRLGRPGDF